MKSISNFVSSSWEPCYIEEKLLLLLLPQETTLARPCEPVRVRACVRRPTNNKDDDVITMKVIAVIFIYK